MIIEHSGSEHGGSEIARWEYPTRMISRRSSGSCSDANNGSNLCVKPVSSSTSLAVGLGIGIPAIVAICVLFYLHSRNLRLQRLEDANDPYKSLDFGMDFNTKTVNKGREKDGPSSGSRLNRQQMSLDISMESPYLLPDSMQHSRDSLASLARTLHNDGADPYRPITQYAGSDGGSMLPLRTGRLGRLDSPLGRDGAATPRSATWGTDSTIAPRRQQPKHAAAVSTKELDLDTLFSKTLPKAFDEPLPPTPPPPAYRNKQTSPFADEHVFARSRSPSASPSISPVSSMPTIQDPPASAHRTNGKSTMPTLLIPQTVAFDTVDGMGHDAPQSLAMSPESVGHKCHADALLANPRPARAEAPEPNLIPMVEEPAEYFDYDHNRRFEQPHIAEERGSNKQRTSHLYQPRPVHGRLGVFVQDNRRMYQMGLRPLPSEEIMDTENPEMRASRIRSFYKEYFDDNNPRHDAVPTMPPTLHEGGAEYDEVYDQNDLGDAAYFDPNSNAFVMPYAQPVARRAMTPPPIGQHLPGPRGASQSPIPGMGSPRPGSSMSNRPKGPVVWGRPRESSTLSGVRLTSPKKAPLSPKDLTTLPTPSKLTHDSFVLMNAMDFAPPESFGRRARGRSQSSLGERKPYRPSVPVSSPLVNAFDELVSLPSPSHHLRKSNTFTALDFAPPRRLTDVDDARSETSSNRSNRSGLSSAQVSALRSGAGRVSSLPGDEVFTRAAMNDQLKPQWGIRP